MILIRATRAAPSSLKEMGRSLTAAWKFRSPQHANRATLRGVAAFPRRPIPFLWHYVRRRPLLHFTALAAVLGAASAACAAQYGLKLIVDAMAQGAEHMTGVWLALAVFVGLLAGESMLWRFGSWLGYRAMLVDKAEARLDLFDHLGGHSSRYFTDVMSGALASVVASTPTQRSPNAWLTVTSVIAARKRSRQAVKVASGALSNRKPSWKSSRSPGSSRRSAATP